MKALVATLVGTLATLGAVAAPAQQTVTYPSSWPLAPNPQISAPPLFGLGEPSGAKSLAPWAASVPLRLSLQSGIFPIAGVFPNCATREDASGNSIQGWPVQRYALLALTPRLVLHGFTSAGCPVDGAVGGGVTYAVPLRASWWLVMGAGIYTRPVHDTIPAETRGDLRIDLMKSTSDGGGVNVGVSRRGISFGGRW